VRVASPDVDAQHPAGREHSGALGPGGVEDPVHGFERVEGRDRVVHREPLADLWIELAKAASHIAIIG
jgi:hypothetical protein